MSFDLMGTNPTLKDYGEAPQEEKTYKKTLNKFLGYVKLDDNSKKMVCNDCYKTPIEIKNKYKNLEIITLPLNPGVTIIRKL